MTGLRHPLLDDAGVRHAFGTRDAAPPPRVVRPRQVHGVAVARHRDYEAIPPEADAIVSRDALCPVGIVTADCVPILAAAGDGKAVAAIHAGWRGLAAGAIAAGIDALRAAGARDVVAVVGPCIAACCYEVDAPVVEPLRQRFGKELASAVHPSERSGHWMLDLGRLALVDLERCGIAARNRSRLRDACTRCDPHRFHSYRRDGQEAGRLLHWVQAHPS